MEECLVLMLEAGVRILVGSDQEFKIDKHLAFRTESQKVPSNKKLKTDAPCHSRGGMLKNPPFHYHKLNAKASLLAGDVTT